MTVPANYGTEYRLPSSDFSVTHIIKQHFLKEFSLCFSARKL